MTQIDHPESTPMRTVLFKSREMAAIGHGKFYPVDIFPNIKSLKTVSTNNRPWEVCMESLRF